MSSVILIITFLSQLYPIIKDWKEKGPSKWHIFGALICLIGLVFNIVDTIQNKAESAQAEKKTDAILSKTDTIQHTQNERTSTLLEQQALLERELLGLNHKTEDIIEQSKVTLEAYKKLNREMAEYNANQEKSILEGRPTLFIPTNSLALTPEKDSLSSRLSFDILNEGARAASDAHFRVYLAILDLKSRCNSWLTIENRDIRSVDILPSTKVTFTSEMIQKDRLQGSNGAIIIIAVDYKDKFTNKNETFYHYIIWRSSNLSHSLTEFGIYTGTQQQLLLNFAKQNGLPDDIIEDLSRIK